MPLSHLSLVVGGGELVGGGCWCGVESGLSVFVFGEVWCDVESGWSVACGCRSRVGVLFSHLVQMVAPACVPDRTLVFLHRERGPSGARAVMDRATCINHVLMLVM